MDIVIKINKMKFLDELRSFALRYSKLICTLNFNSQAN